MAPIPGFKQVDENVALALATSKSVRQISKLLKDNSRSRELKRFYGHLMVHCVFVSDHITRIKSVLGLDDKLIIRALQIFESLIAEKGSTADTLARQRALNDRWGRLRSQSVEAKLEFATHCLVVAGPLGLHGYDESFDEWQEDVVARYPEDGTQWLVDDRPPPKKARPEPSYIVSSAAQSLFRVLEDSQCDCQPTHKLGARLCLGTYRKPDLDYDHDFDMFLATNSDWQEAHIHTVRDSVVRFVIGDESQSKVKKLDYKPMVVKALCKQIEKMQSMASQRLELKIERNRLLKLRSEKSCFRIDKTRPTVSLQHFIQEGSRSLTEKIKRILAVLLGYAVLHLHGTPWLQSTWDSSQVLFFQTSSSKIPLRPFIQAQLNNRQALVETSSAVQKAIGNPQQLEEELEEIDPDDLDLGDLDPDDVEHPIPSLVTLAMMLMELYFATPFEVLASNRGIELPKSINNSTRLLDVTLVFDAHKREIPMNSQFYYAIEKCLDPGTWQDEWRQRLDDHVMRSLVYQEVVRPLEDELCDAFDYITIDELDKIAETVDVGAWGQTIQNQPTSPYTESMTSSEGVLTSQHRYATEMHPAFLNQFLTNLNLRGTSPISLLSQGRESPLKSEQEVAKFYDDERPPETYSRSEVENYLNWKVKYKDVYTKYIDPYINDTSHRRVRIAVLDSGVDDTHNALDTGQIKTKRNWTNKFHKAAHDSNGHGTFTTSLIVDYCPDAELYIAKIAEKSPCSPAVVAEVIKTAVDEWDVDIISMSFGYPSNQIDGYETLERALLHAHSRNVLMFAAASNSGANLDRAYPARDPHVICIHSTDADGNRSKFSPTALAWDVNLATIGEAIESAWPVQLCDIDANPDCLQYKSGTSYATPIAVGIAAFLLQYARLHLPESAGLLKRQSKMRDVLVKIAEKTQHSISRDNYHYFSLSLFSDNLFGKDKQFIDVTLRELLKR